MTEDAAQRRRWTFYEFIILGVSRFEPDVRPRNRERLKRPFVFAYSPIFQILLPRPKKRFRRVAASFTKTIGRISKMSMDQGKGAATNV